jgi:hypothetical protein
VPGLIALLGGTLEPGDPLTDVTDQEEKA